VGPHLTVARFDHAGDAAEHDSPGASQEAKALPIQERHATLATNPDVLTRTEIERTFPTSSPSADVKTRMPSLSTTATRLSV
jgi:hypothetical protein